MKCGNQGTPVNVQTQVLPIYSYSYNNFNTFHNLNCLYRNVMLITHSIFNNFAGTAVYYVDSSDITRSSCLSHIQRIILQRTMGT